VLREKIEAEAAAAEAGDDAEAGAADAALELDVDAAAKHAAAVELEPDGRTDEQRAKQLGGLMDDFESSLRDVLGADEPLVPVPMEGALGFMLPGALELKPHERFRRCVVCNGHGQVLTGSIADNQQTADCPRCSGRGYLERLDEPQPPTDGVQGATNGAGDDDAAFGVPKWMGDPGIRQG
jgi:hypothetical protein